MGMKYFLANNNKTRIIRDEIRSKENEIVDYKGKMKLGYNKITSRIDVDHNNQRRWIDLLKLLFSCFYVACICHIYFKKQVVIFLLIYFRKVI